MNEQMHLDDENDVQIDLTDNAVTVLKQRYLAKDSQGEIQENPRLMFERVARNVASVDVLYDSRIYNPDGKKDDVNLETETCEDEDLPAIPGLTDYDVETLYQGYQLFKREGKISAEFSEVVEVARDKIDDIRATAAEFFHAMTQRKFLPNSPTLMNAGRELQQLSACFVLPIEDSMESIFESIKNAALIHKSGGGTGFSFSRLRPTNDVVRTTGGVASGPVSFLRVFNAATEAVKQGGTRRGANMGILRVDHPDILEFITCKQDNQAVTNFNLSVAITDDFMEALKEDKHYDLINPRSGEVVDTASATEVFDLITEMAWKNGEPGVVFLDRINDENPTPQVGAIESTNPCGEQPLLPYESCNLGSINLSLFGPEPDWIANEDKSTVDIDILINSIDWQGLRETVHLAVHFLDNVIDANKYPIDQIGKVTRENRKIGLGVMGWAELLLKLGVPYDSEEAVVLAEEVMSFINEESKKASCRWAETRGTFPNYDRSIYADEERTPRNATTTTIAPTGTISIIGGTSGGVEPLFSIAFTRHVLDDEKLVEVNDVFEEISHRAGFYSPEIMKKIAEGSSLSEHPEISSEVERVFVTALDIDPEWHIKMQAAFQKHTDNAVSKTINFPEKATQEEIGQAFCEAYDRGCKGLTVYRNASRSEQVLTVGSDSQDDEDNEDSHDALQGTNGQWGQLRPIERTSRLHGITVRKATPMGNLFLTLNTFEGHPFEMFAQIGKAGSDVAAFTEGIARLISLAFRSGVDPSAVAEQLIGIGGSRSVGFGPNRVRSVPDAIGQFIKDYLESSSQNDEEEPFAQLGLKNLSRGSELNNDGHAATVDADGNGNNSYSKNASLCPSCGVQSLIYEEGCVKCMSCGFSEC